MKWLGSESKDRHFPLLYRRESLQLTIEDSSYNFPTLISYLHFITLVTDREIHLFIIEDYTNNKTAIYSIQLISEFTESLVSLPKIESI